LEGIQSTKGTTKGLSKSLEIPRELGGIIPGKTRSWGSNFSTLGFEKPFLNGFMGRISGKGVPLQVYILWGKTHDHRGGWFLTLWRPRKGAGEERVPQHNRGEGVLGGGNR